jgi:membrane protein implicated in regulation of membrane protease activity
MMMTLVTGIAGIAMLVAFLGTLVWWIRALPFTIIVVAVVLMLLWDFVQTVRSSSGGAGR